MYHKIRIFILLSLFATGLSAQTKESLAVADSTLLNQYDSLFINLPTVTIQGKQSPVKLEAGKTTVNIASSILASQGSAFDVLKVLPGVFIKEDGSVSLNGQAGVNVLINGKTTYLSGENLVSLLKSMPASSVEKIELLTNPTAEYDASGKGVINIKMIKNLYLGTSGSLNANYWQGKQGRGYASGLFNFQNEKLSVSVTYSHYQGNQPNTINIFRGFLTEANPNNETLLMNQHNRTIYKDANNYFRISTDYDISKKVMMNAYFSGFRNHRIVPSDNRTEFSRSGLLPDSILSTSILNDITYKSYSGGIYTEYKDDSKREINLSADYMFYNHGETINMESR